MTMSPDEVAGGILDELANGRRTLVELHNALKVDARYILRTLHRLVGVSQVKAHTEGGWVLYALPGDEPKPTPKPRAASKRVAAPVTLIVPAPEPSPALAPEILKPFIRLSAGRWICFTRGCAAVGETPAYAFKAWQHKQRREAA